MTQFNWIEATKTRAGQRKAYIYAALSAAKRSDETYEEFRLTASGYVTPGSHAWLKARDRETSINLYSIAVRNGFIDC